MSSVAFPRLPGRSAHALKHNELVDAYETAKSEYDAQVQALSVLVKRAQDEEPQYHNLRGDLDPREDMELRAALSWPHKSCYTADPKDVALKELDDWYQRARAALVQLYADKAKCDEVRAMMETVPHALHDELHKMHDEHDRLYKAMHQAKQAVIEHGRTAKRARGA